MLFILFTFCQIDQALNLRQRLLLILLPLPKINGKIVKCGFDPVPKCPKSSFHQRLEYKYEAVCWHQMLDLEWEYFARNALAHTQCVHTMPAMKWRWNLLISVVKFYSQKIFYYLPKQRQTYCERTDIDSLTTRQPSQTEWHWARAHGPSEHYCKTHKT